MSCPYVEEVVTRVLNLSRPSPTAVRLLGHDKCSNVKTHKVTVHWTQEMHTRQRKTKSNPSSEPPKRNSRIPESRNHRKFPGPWIFLLAIGILVPLFYYIKEWYFAPHKMISSGSRSTPGSEDQSTYKVIDIPGKGKGVVATRDIRQGELVIRERPLFVVPHETSSPTALIASALANATRPGREAFLNLSYVNFPKHLDPAKHPDEVALAIFQTNAVAAGEGVGIFPGMARLNHGCSSAFNVVYSWREREGELFIHALKNIRQGDELLTTYTNTKKPRVERRAFLSTQYGFHCTCSVCSLPDDQSLASDARLSTISQLYGQFSTWGARKMSGAQAIGIVRRIWALENEEGYWSERGRLAADAAWVAAAHSDVASTRDWAQLALEWYTYELGTDNAATQEMWMLLRHGPDSHPAWASREAMHVGGP